MHKKYAICSRFFCIFILKWEADVVFPKRYRDKCIVKSEQIVYGKLVGFARSVLFAERGGDNDIKSDFTEYH